MRIIKENYKEDVMLDSTEKNLVAKELVSDSIKDDENFDSATVQDETKTSPEVIDFKDLDNEVIDINENSDEECYNPFPHVGGAKTVGAHSIENRIGPFADKRVICQCDMIKQLMARNDVRYLLGLLPDMSQMNSKQKDTFKNKVVELMNRILQDPDLS